MDTKERRRMLRRPVQLLAKCVWETRKGRVEADAWVKNVHENGLLLESPRFDEGEEASLFPKGQKMKIRGFFYDEQGEHPLAAKVCWVNKVKEGGWSAGVEFTNDGGARRPASFKDFLRVVRDENG